MFGHQDDLQQPQDPAWGADAGQAAPPADDASQPVVPPADDTPLTEAAKADDQVPATVTPTAKSDDSDALLDIKQKALQQLSPLVGQLDQSPEEKFRTTMMLIQASDNRELVSVAYEAANQIPDEKSRAQALLDIVNEINYFTQH